MPVDLERSRKKKKRNSFLFMLSILIVFLVVVGIFFVAPLVIRWLPNFERKDLNEWFEVSGDEVRIYLDLEAQMDTEAFYEDGKVYIPFDFAHDQINSRFYYNETESLLSYTLPSETIDMDMDTLDSEGRDELKLRDGALYISLDLLERYTDIYVEEFVSQEYEAKRVFITRGGFSVEQGRASRNTSVRENADKEGAILTTLRRDDGFKMTESDGGWSRIKTDDGFIGYVDNDYITMLNSAYVYPDTYDEPVVPHTSFGEEKVILGFHAIYSFEDNAALQTLYEGTGGRINVIVPMWLQINDADGDLTDFSSAAYVEEAHNLGLQVWASVDNVNQPGGINDFDSAAFFADTGKRREFIERLMDLADQYGYDGLNIDLESIAPEGGEAFTQFMRELSVSCREHGLILCIDSHVPYSYNAHYNLPEQAVFADFSLIMCYDEHTGSDIGPVASSTFTEFGISESLKSVPADQLIIALPFYTRIWHEDADGNVTSEAIGMQEASQYVSNNGISLSWDDDNGSYYGETFSDNVRTSVWMEDEESLDLKVSYIESYDVVGLATWRLGFEPASIWDTLDLNAGLTESTDSEGEVGSGPDTTSLDEISTGMEG